MRGLAGADMADPAGPCETEGGGDEVSRDAEGEEERFASSFSLLLRRAAQETLALLPGRAIV
eukprot:scaffold29265_cov21-Phaeocystis_antarctica.AAC.1